MKDPTTDLLGLLIVIALAVCIFCVGYSAAPSQLKTQTVEAGVGTYDVDASGNTTFRFLTKEQLIEEETK